MPWGSWITCEETVNGPDVGAGLHRRFQRPADSSATASSSRSRPAASPTGCRSRRPAASPTRRRRSTRGTATCTSRRTTSASRRASTATPRRATRWRRVGSRTGASCRCWPSRACPTPTSRATQPTNARYRVDVGRHRRPRPDVPVHAGPDGADDEQRRAQYVGRQGLAAGRRPLLPARGRRLRARRRVLLLDTGWRPGRSRATPTPFRDGATGRARSGRTTTRSRSPRARLPVAWSRHARLPGQRHHRGPRPLVLCEDNVNDNFLRAPQPLADGCRTSP